MTKRTETTTKRTRTKVLSPDTIKAYREHAAGVPVAEQIDALNDHSINHNALLDAGLPELAHAAEWCWLTAGLILAQTPVATLDEAMAKVAYLEMCLADWVLPGAQRHPNVAGMIYAAVTAERKAWSIPIDKSGLH